MSFDPLTAALVIGGSAAASGATSAVQARAQNQAIKRSMESQRQAAQVKRQQLAEQAGAQREQRIREAQQIQGRLRVVGSEAGIGLGGSIGQLQNQAAFDASRNVGIIEQNLQNQVRAVNTGLAANINRLASQRQNPILSGFMGGLQGLQTGLQIQQGLGRLNQ